MALEQQKRILITGGTGFIGSRLALRCLECGHRVRVFGQANTPSEHDNQKLIEAAGVEVVLGSVTERDKVSHAVRGMDVVYHLAAAQHEMNMPDQKYRDINVTGTQNVLDTSVAAGIGRLIYGSTIGVYGSPNGQLDERSPVRPDNLYGQTKLAAENLVRSLKGRLHVVIIRISETYGPGDHRLLKLFTAINGGIFFVVGGGENLHHMIFIDDLVNGLQLAARAEVESGEDFVLAGKEVASTNQIVAAIAAEVGTEPPRWHAPMWLFMAIAVLLETVLKPLGIQPPLHRRRMDFFKKDFTFSIQKAAAMLGFQPAVGLKDGVKRTADWYRQTNQL
jgi:dihydroflavonol-4-reductase